MPFIRVSIDDGNRSQTPVEGVSKYVPATICAYVPDAVSPYNEGDEQSFIIIRVAVPKQSTIDKIRRLELKIDLTKFLSQAEIDGNLANRSRYLQKLDNQSTPEVDALGVEIADLATDVKLGTAAPILYELKRLERLTRMRVESDREDALALADYRASGKKPDAVNIIDLSGASAGGNQPL